jgi:hypothetical protein
MEQFTIAYAGQAGAGNQVFSGYKEGVVLFDAYVGIPGALRAAYVDDLADMVAVVGADGADRLRRFFQLGFVGSFHPLFDVSHDLIELLHGIVPGLGVELIEGFVFLCFL